MASRLNQKNFIINDFTQTIQNMGKRLRAANGMEMAIMLTAFFTAASVIVYGVLFAGIFSAEHGKRTVYQGLSQAQASVQIIDPIIVTVSSGKVTNLTFTLSSILNNESVDMTPPGATHANTTIINYIDRTGNYSDIIWTATPMGIHTGETSGMLKPNEAMEINIALPKGANLSPNDIFTLQVIPAKGASIIIQRTVPGLSGGVQAGG